MTLDLEMSGAALTAALVDIPSVSGSESRLADDVEEALRSRKGLEVLRDGNALVARTTLGLPTRVVLAGHLDTVPVAKNLPSRKDGDRLYGCGTSDMKSGIAVMLRLVDGVTKAAEDATREVTQDVTFVFYDNEEVEAAKSGLGRLARNHRSWLDAEFAVLLEPTSARVEAGCQGTIRALVVVPGKRAHSARAWLGENAIHGAGEVLTRLSAYEARSVTLDGLLYREGINAVRIEGGVAGNVIPDRCTMTINYRFAPDRTEAEAFAHLQDVLDPYECVLTDSAPGAMPGLSAPAAADFLASVGGDAVAKFGWTDVARFAELGIPAVNFGPGDPNLAHTREEYVETPRIAACEKALRRWITTGAPTAGD